MGGPWSELVHSWGIRESCGRMPSTTQPQQLFEAEENLISYLPHSFRPSPVAEYDVSLMQRGEAAWQGASPGIPRRHRRSVVPLVVGFPILSRDRQVEAPKPGV